MKSVARYYSWRRKLFRLATGIGLLTVAGCTVGPSFHPPQVQTPEAWLGTGALPKDRQPAQTPAAPPGTPAQPVPLAVWWTVFKDPLLDSLVSRAVAENLDLKQAESRIRQARAQRQTQVAGLWPTLGAAGERLRTRASGAGMKPVDFYQAGFDAAWELDVFGGTRRAVEAATADLHASIEDRRDVLVTLISEVALNYITLRGVQQQIVIANDNLEAQQRTVDLTRQRFRDGFNSKLDVVNAEAQAATTRAEIPVLETAVRQTIYALGVLLGQPPAALVAELSAAKALPLTPPDVPLGLPAELLRRRPDIRRAEAQLHSATARIGVATADLFPKFSLTGSLGDSYNHLTGLVSWDHRFYSFGPSVTWSLFDAGRICANIRVQDELEEQALLQYRTTLLTALSDVESALVAYVNEQQHRQALVEAVSANREAVALSTTLYTQGQTDFLNVLTAQRSLFTSQDALVQSEHSIAIDLVTLYKALGGGWETEDDKASAP